MQKGNAQEAECCGCNQHKVNYILFSEIKLAPMLGIYELYVAGVIKGGTESVVDSPKKTVVNCA